MDQGIGTVLNVRGKNYELIVDTREQLPLWKESKTVKHMKLDVGDYTTLSC